MPMSPRLLRPRASGGFDPRSISGCVCNLDASVLSSLRQNSDGTTAAVATDDPVGYWQDLSANGNHAKQTVATGSRPFLKLNNQNGRPGLLFDGSNDWLTSTISGIQSFQSITALFVYKSAAAAAADTNSVALFTFGNLGSASGSYIASGIGAISSTGVMAGEYISIAHTLSSFAGRLGSSTYRRSANTAQMLAVQMGTGGSAIVSNNSAVSLNLTPNITTSTNTGPASLGWTADEELHIGGSRSGATIAATPEATFHQVMIYNRVLTATELTTIWDAMRRKWGIT